MMTDGTRTTTVRKLMNALAGFALGIVLLPLAIPLLPLAAAAYLWSETDGGGNNSGETELKGKGEEG